MNDVGIELNNLLLDSSCISSIYKNLNTAKDRGERIVKYLESEDYEKIMEGFYNIEAILEKTDKKILKAINELNL